MSAPVITRAVQDWPAELAVDDIIPRMIVSVPGRLHEEYAPQTLSAFAKVFGVHAAAIEAMGHHGAELTAALVISGEQHVAFSVRYERHRGGGFRWRCTQHAGRAK